MTTTKQTRRNTDIFNSDSTLRQTARNAVVEPFVEAISIWRDSNGNMNMSTEGGGSRRMLDSTQP